VQLENRRQLLKVSTHELLNQQHEIHYIRTIPISAFFGGSYLGGSSKHKSSVSIKGKPGKKSLTLLAFIKEFGNNIQEFSRTIKGLK